MKNKATKSILIIFAVLFISASLQGVFAQEQVDWKEYETKHFIIKYHDLDEGTLSMIAEEAENAYDKVTLDLRYHPDNKTVVRIGPDEKDHDKGWEGSYGVGSKLIDLQSPAQRRWNFFSNYSYYIQDSVIHEFTHHILSEGYKIGFPDWLNEGIATYEANDKIEEFYGDRKFKNAVSKDELLSLVDMWSFYFQLEEDEIPLAYVESYTVIEFIVNTYGHDGLLDMLKSRRDNPDMDEVIKNTFVVSYEEFEQGWMNFVKEKYGQPLHELYLYDVFYLIGAALLLRRGVRIWTKRKRN